MNSVNPLAPAKKYLITYGKKRILADHYDYNPASGVLNAEGTVLMIFNQDQLKITNNHDIHFQ